MMHLFFLLMTLLASPAFAGSGGDSPKPAVKAAIENCLAESAKANKQPEACIGVAADACLEKGEDPSTFGMIACHGDEADVWDDRLNRDYQVLMKSVDKERIRDLERAWLVFRDKKCSYHQVEDDGQVGMIENIRCYMQETGRQALFLHDIVDTQNSRK